MNHRFTRPNLPPDDRIMRYETQGTFRTVSFALPDGTRRFLSYANLVTGDHTAEGVVVLTFTTHVVTLKGRNLAPLVEDFATQRIRSLAATEGRYLAIEGPTPDPLVTEISMKSA